MTENSVAATTAAVLERVAAEAGVGVRNAAAVAQLLGEGCTIPFIARYRKEAHGGLDEVQITAVRDRLLYHTELEERRAAVLKSIESQGKLTDALRARIEACSVKAALEDLYQPYKPKRRTLASIAREQGLEPLADSIWDGSAADLSARTAQELEGARHILAERVADNAGVRGYVRETYARRAVLRTEVAEPRPTAPTKYEQYYEFEEPLAAMPSHRFLAIKRGQKEGVLWVRLALDQAALAAHVREVLADDGVAALPPECEEQLALAIAEALRKSVCPSCEIDVTVAKKEEADRAAVDVFAENLRHLLLASPLGEKAVLAIDPGIRTGCKTVVLDATGKFLANTVVFPQRSPAEAASTLEALIRRYRPEAIAVGNGTAGRETEAFARRLVKERFPDSPPMVVSVSESGASVYSASEVARDEFPDLDLTVRGAISIGRRLQDPLAELVKIDPKAIGVGQYQHDVHESMLESKLDEVVVSCVNGVGVELNTASAPLLRRVSGIGDALARRIVAWREGHGTFRSREDLKQVNGLGPKAFEQSAGFLRIRNAANPLDASAVHPERYALVERMAADLGVAVGELVGNARLVDRIDVRKYVSGEVGEPTLRDIVAELKKPGRDPREEFAPPAFRDDVTTIDDVAEGMSLEGVVTNVTAFGAFVDIGVHQDGLVHVSELSDRYVRDPSEVVKAGDRVKVRVLAVDRDRGRISLTCRSGERVPRAARAPGDRRGAGPRAGRADAPRGGFVCNPFANL